MVKNHSKELSTKGVIKMKKVILSCTFVVISCLSLTGCGKSQTQDIGIGEDYGAKPISIIPAGPFRYDVLTDEQKVMYDTFSTNLQNPKREFTVFEYEGTYNPDYLEDAQIARLCYQMDNPLDNQLVQMYWVGDYTRDDESFEILATYQDRCYSIDEAKAMQQEVTEIVTEFVMNLDGLSDVEKYRRIHDWLANSTYDMSLAEDSHTIYSAIKEHNTVCDGYAYSFKYMCDVADLPCVVVAGQVPSANCVNPEDANGHAWNVVPIDNEWKLVDITYDVNIGELEENKGVIVRDYFLCDSVYENGRVTYPGIRTPGYYNY